MNATRAFAGLAFAFACAPARAPSADGAAGSGTTTGTTSSSGETLSSASATTLAAETSDGESTGVPSPCGNGVIDPGEDCDDGDTIDGDGCDGLCRAAASESWRVTVVNGCPPMAVADDAAVVLAATETHGGQIDPAWTTVHTLVLAPDGSIVADVQSDGAVGSRVAWAAAPHDGGFVLVGREITETGTYAFVEPWSSAGAPGLEVPIDDFGDSEVVALARGSDDVLWMVEKSLLGQRFSLRGAVPAPAAWSLPLDDGSSDLTYDGFRIAVDGEHAYLRADAYDTWLQRWSSDGMHLWQLAWDDVTDPPPLLAGIAVAPRGDVVAVGRVMGRAWIRRHDRDGALVWSIDIQIGEQPRRDYPREVAVDVDGTILVAGETHVPSDNADAWYAWLAAFDADGNERWRHRIAPPRDQDPATSQTFVCALATTQLRDHSFYLLARDGASTWLARFVPPA